MPFTFSHPAASAPLARYGFNLSALIIGSLAPDFLYFFLIIPDYKYGHTLPGVFLFCFPAGLAALWLFHAIVKRPLASLLPVGMQKRLYPYLGDFTFGPPRRFLQISASLMAGTLTHLVWDSFTHQDAWLVQQVPFLSKNILTLMGSPVKLYTILQYGSSLLGALLLGWWIIKWFRRAPVYPYTAGIQLPPSAKRRYILALGLINCLPTLLFGAANLALLADIETFRLFLNRIAIVNLSILFTEIFIFSLFWQIKIARAD
jgi:hypothetical protein